MALAEVAEVWPFEPCNGENPGAAIRLDAGR